MNTIDGRKDRKSRLCRDNARVAATSSQDLIILARELYSLSAIYARKYDGNVSIYTLVGIPIIFSAIRALLIEANTGVFGKGRCEKNLSKLSSLSNEIKFIEKNYKISEVQVENLSLLYEIRNEILHPAHALSKTPDGTPEYWEKLRTLNLLQNGSSLFAQLKSHRLFDWAMNQTVSVVERILEMHYIDTAAAKSHLSSYSRYKEYDL